MIETERTCVGTVRRKCLAFSLEYAVLWRVAAMLTPTRKKGGLLSVTSHGVDWKRHTDAVS